MQVRGRDVGGCLREGGGDELVGQPALNIGAEILVGRRCPSWTAPGPGQAGS